MRIQFDLSEPNFIRKEDIKPHQYLILLKKGSDIYVVSADTPYYLIDISTGAILKKIWDNVDQTYEGWAFLDITEYRKKLKELL
jgi:hypothetical protein